MTTTAAPAAPEVVTEVVFTIPTQVLDSDREEVLSQIKKLPDLVKGGVGLYGKRGSDGDWRVISVSEHTVLNALTELKGKYAGQKVRSKAEILALNNGLIKRSPAFFVKNADSLYEEVYLGESTRGK